ncbi:AAA family ATPase [Kribbella sp. NPDC058693]|uniref:AAA family ATPase n=1 Tax=Kribbella sp. NPDC058693 TaxID=3346602 RepID=UPI0036590160
MTELPIAYGRDYGDVDIPPPWDEDEQAGEQSASNRSKVRADELRALLVDAAGLRDIRPPEPIVDGWLYADSLAWLSGKPGHAKSFLAVDLACSIGTGRSWHGHDTTPGRVVYVIAEGASGLGRRVEAWSLANGTAVDQVAFLPVPVHLMTSLDVSAFSQLLAELRPLLVILDTQARVTTGAEENSSRDMGLFVEALERLRRESGACVLVVHHEPRNGDNLRGSTALEGAATTIIRTSKDGSTVGVTNPKQKDAPAQPAMTLSLISCGESAILSHEAVGLVALGTESELELLSVIRDSFGTAGATKSELKEATNQPKTTYYRSIKALIGKGLVIERKEGRSTVYTLAVDNRQEEIPISPTESQ